jgi:pimeloyl-ACP methyl ester carboxylesterase
MPIINGRRMMGRRCSGLVVLLALSMLAAVPQAIAAPLEARIKLHDGKLATADLSRALLETFHIRGVTLNAGQINMSGIGGWTLVRALDSALGDGCNIHVDKDALVLSVDPSRLPHSIRAAKQSVEVFTAVCAPEATERQKRNYGLLMPQKVYPARPMIVLIHGLDCDRACWTPMAALLQQQGYQVAYFSYPSDGALDRSSAMLTRQMTALREEFPAMPLDIIAHSMGALVARDYVEGNAYAGGVRHLILLGPPNLGSKWAPLRFALELQEHWRLWRHNRDWSPTWMITDGLGEAGSDLEPRSAFLERLNQLPRRGGVSYTIIAGAQNPIYSIGAGALSRCASVIPDRAAHWWGFRQTESALHHAANKLRGHVGASDGPVTLKSTRLAGVTDYVKLPCDHAGLYCPENNGQIAAWDIIKNRLAQ